jgi:hypothetical protein
LRLCENGGPDRKRDKQQAPEQIWNYGGRKKRDIFVEREQDLGAAVRYAVNGEI